MINDIHIILATPDSRLADTFCEKFKKLHATVYVAKDRFDAVGLYWNLYHNNTIPNVFVGDYWLTEPQTALYDAEQDIIEACSCLPVIRTIQKLDEDTACYLLTEPGKTYPCTDEYGFDAITYLEKSKYFLSILEKHIRQDSKVANQRYRKTTNTYTKVRSDH